MARTRLLTAALVAACLLPPGAAAEDWAARLRADAVAFHGALQASHPGYVVRMAGGGIFASGMLLMALNTWLTVRRRRDERAPQASPLLAG